MRYNREMNEERDDDKYLTLSTSTSVDEERPEERVEAKRPVYTDYTEVAADEEDNDVGDFLTASGSAEIGDRVTHTEMAKWVSLPTTSRAKKAETARRISNKLVNFLSNWALLPSQQRFINNRVDRWVSDRPALFVEAWIKQDFLQFLVDNCDDYPSKYEYKDKRWCTFCRRTLPMKISRRMHDDQMLFWLSSVCGINSQTMITLKESRFTTAELFSLALSKNGDENRAILYSLEISDTAEQEKMLEIAEELGRRMNPSKYGLFRVMIKKFMIAGFEILWIVFMYLVYETEQSEWSTGMKQLHLITTVGILITGDLFVHSISGGSVIWSTFRWIGRSCRKLKPKTQHCVATDLESCLDVHRKHPKTAITVWVIVLAILIVVVAVGVWYFGYK